MKSFMITRSLILHPSSSYTNFSLPLLSYIRSSSIRCLRTRLCFWRVRVRSCVTTSPTAPSCNSRSGIFPAKSILSIPRSIRRLSSADAALLFSSSILRWEICTYIEDTVGHLPGKAHSIVRLTIYFFHTMFLPGWLRWCPHEIKPNRHACLQSQSWNQIRSFHT